MLNQELVNYQNQILALTGGIDLLSNIIKKVGGYPNPVIDKNEYDNLFLVTEYESNQAKVINLRYDSERP